MKTQKENPNGLHARYTVKKLVPYKPKFGKSRYMEVEPDPSAEYFVMRLDEGGSDIEHIKACRIGVHAYADAIEHKLPQLATDLRERYPLIP